MKKKYGLEALHYIILVVILTFVSMTLSWYVRASGIIDLEYGLIRAIGINLFFISIVFISVDLFLHNTLKI